MALKGDRVIIAEEATLRLDEVKERGYFVMHRGSGYEGYLKVVDTDVAVAAPVVGCLLNDVIADTSATGPVNYQKAFQVFKGGVVPVLRIGRIRTNVIREHTADSIDPGDRAYVNQSGVLTDASTRDGYTFRPVGYFESDPDSDGYAYVWVNL